MKKMSAIAAGAIMMLGSPLMAEVGEFNISVNAVPNILDGTFCKYRNPTWADMHTQLCDEKNPKMAYGKSRPVAVPIVSGAPVICMGGKDPNSMSNRCRTLIQQNRSKYLAVVQN